MSELAQLQKAFAEALEGGDAPLEVFKTPQGMPLHLRFDVYRNNVFGAVSRSMEGLYPVFHKLVGPDFFTQCVRAYFESHPAQAGDLLNYGYEFGAFLQEYPPCADHLYLSDVAKVEAAWQQAYMAAEAQALDGQKLSEVPGEEMAELRFKLHPSCRFLITTTPASHIWEAASQDKTDQMIDPTSGGEHLLIMRPGHEVEVRRLDAASYVFLNSLHNGESLGIAYAAAIAQNPEFDLQNTLVAHLEGRSFTNFTRGPSKG